MSTSAIQFLASGALAIWLLLTFAVLREVGNRLSKSVRILGYVGLCGLPAAAVGFWSVTVLLFGTLAFVVVGLLIFAVYNANHRAKEGHPLPFWYRML